MYLLQERQLKARRPGTFYYRLPSLETLDRLTFRALTLGFPFLTVGLMLGALWTGRFHPLIAFSAVAWVIYAFTLASRVVAGWRGRRAAYCAILADPGRGRSAAGAPRLLRAPAMVTSVSPRLGRPCRPAPAARPAAGTFGREAPPPVEA